jgi:adenine-specific DNA-methyltransferase
MMTRKPDQTVSPQARAYRRPEAEALMRPEVGTQAQFRKQKPPAKYRYDDSLDPAMSWDEGSAAREQGEALIREILEAEDLETAKAAAARLKAMSAPFLAHTEIPCLGSP